MTYKSDEYNKLDRNHTRIKAALRMVDTARDFNLLKYVDRATITATTRDGARIEIDISGNLKSALVSAGAAHCTNEAKAISAEGFEAVDFEKAAAV